MDGGKWKIGRRPRGNKYAPLPMTRIAEMEVKEGRRKKEMKDDERKMVKDMRIDRE